MGETVWLAEPPEAYLTTMLRVVVVLLWQHENQLKSEFSWIPHLVIGYLLI